MALKIIFNGQTIKYPSGSGPKECPECKGKRCWMTYGPNRENEFAFRESCLDCGYSHQNENWKEYKD